MKICIDPGHGGKKPGAVYQYTDGRMVKESDINLRYSRIIHRQLLEAGHEVITTRGEDDHVTLRDRVEISNENNCDQFISIHCNSSLNRAAQGAEVIHFEGSRLGTLWADRIRTGIEEEMIRCLLDRKPMRRLKSRGDLKVLRSTRCPAVLVELDFLSSEVGRRILHSKFYMQAIPRVIAKSLEPAW